MIKISTVSKLDGVHSWSLPAVDSCPGAHAGNGELVEVCQGCYARGGNYRFAVVRNAREHNLEDWKRSTWSDDMVSALRNDAYFRWFDSGDVYRWELAIKIHEVIQRTPWCKHWLPTRSHKVPHIRVVLEMINREPNAVVRYSSDQINQYDPTLHGSVVVTENDVPENVHLCEAYTRSPATCSGCRACWDKNVSTIGYVAHGQKAAKLIKTLQLAA